MPKSMLNLTIDTELIELAKAKGLNMSKEVNDYLKSLLTSQNKDIPSDETVIMQELRDNEITLIENTKRSELLKRKLKEIDNKRKAEIERRSRQIDLGQYRH